MGQRTFPTGTGNNWLRLIKLAALLLGAVHLGSFPASADPAKNQIGMFLEPAHFAPDISHPVKGAEKTVLVPARRTAYGVDRFTAEEWKQEGLDLPSVQLEALELASRLNASAEVEWVRDHREVVQYAIIQSKHPFISSILFPMKEGKNEFVQRFAEVLGKEVLVVIPERHTLYVFPRYTSTLQEYGPNLAQRYHEAPLKASLEVFLVTEAGCQVVGVIGG